MVFKLKFLKEISFILFTGGSWPITAETINAIRQIIFEFIIIFSIKIFEMKYKIYYLNNENREKIMYD